MSVKKIIAREWLYLLGFALGSIALGVATFELGQPNPVSPPAHPLWEVEDKVDAQRCYLDQEQTREFKHRLEQFREAGWGRFRLFYVLWSSLWTDSMREQTDYDRYLELSGSRALPKMTAHEYLTAHDSLKAVQEWLARTSRQNWDRQHRLYQAYVSSLERISLVSEIFIILPYPLFLFIRTVIWSVRQVREPI